MKENGEMGRHPCSGKVIKWDEICMSKWKECILTNIRFFGANKVDFHLIFEE